MLTAGYYSHRATYDTSGTDRTWLLRRSAPLACWVGLSAVFVIQMLTFTASVFVINPPAEFTAHIDAPVEKIVEEEQYAKENAQHEIVQSPAEGKPLDKQIFKICRYSVLLLLDNHRKGRKIRIPIGYSQCGM